VGHVECKCQTEEGVTHQPVFRVVSEYPQCIVRFYTRTWLRYVRVFAIANPPICRLSVTFVHLTQEVEPFGNISSAFCTLAIFLLLLSRVALGRGVVGYIKLSRERSLGRSVGLSVQCIVEKRLIGSGCRLASYVGRVQSWGRYCGLGIGSRGGVLFGANFGRAIVTNGDFRVYVCYSAATRPSSQIILGRLVIIMNNNFSLP